REHRERDDACVRPNARKVREASGGAATDRRAEAEGSRGGEGVQSRARQDTGQKEIRPVGKYALGIGFESTRSARRPYPTHDSSDLFAAAGNRAMRDRPSPLVRGEIVVGDRGPGRPLIRRAMNAVRGREALQVISAFGAQS